MEFEDPIALLVRTPAGLVFAGLWGAIWGSFFNVAVYRIGAAAEEDDSATWLGSARQGLSSLRRLVHPPSRCPGCGSGIRWYDNVPVLGWVLLRGRCRDCKIPISPIYPAVELASVVLAVAIFQRFVIDEPAAPVVQLSRFFVYFFFSGTLLVLSLIDGDTMLLPLAITLPSIPAFFLAGRALPDVAATDALLGAGVGFGGLFLLRHGYRLITGREGLGGGDEMLVAIVGALLGWRALPFTLFVGASLGILCAVPVLILARLGRPPGEGDPSLRHAEVPFGPFLASAAMIYLFFGRWLWAALNAWVIGE
ncbi:MAG: prepilin peptidase [Myxococcales bacterium]|nr:prepilin peptidase [Myxococcales bacterium]